MPLCRVYHCKTKSGDPNYKDITAHRFPARDLETARKWLVACKIEWDGSLKEYNFKGKIVCSKHFLPSDYEDDSFSRLMLGSGKIDKPRPKRLKPTAVPTVDLYGQLPEKVSTKDRKQRAQKRAVSNINFISHHYMYRVYIAY